MLDFGGGIPGYLASRQFRLETLAPELQPFCVMRSVSETGISFVLVAPGTFFPDYTIEFDEQHVATLGLESADDAMVLASVTLGRPPTANLLGPPGGEPPHAGGRPGGAVPVELPGGRTAGAAVRSLSVLQGGREPGHGFGGGRGALDIGLLDLEVDLFAVHLDLQGGVDTDTHLVAGDDENGDLDVVADHDAFTDTTAEN